MKYPSINQELQSILNTVTKYFSLDIRRVLVTKKDPQKPSFSWILKLHHQPLKRITMKYYIWLKLNKIRTPYSSNVLLFYRVRARVRRDEATVRVLVLPADVTALVALGALYLDTGQFLLYVFVLHDPLKVDLEREFSRVSKCLCNMHVHDFNYSSQIWESVINFNILELIEFNKKYSFYTIQLIQKKKHETERVTFGDDENWFLNTEKKKLDDI